MSGVTLTSIAAKVMDAKNIVGALIAFAAVALMLGAQAKVPSKLDEHVKQTDALLQRVDDTNKQLRIQTCILAKSDTPLHCLLNTK